MSFERVAVIGAGAWGTALAQVAALAGHEVSLLSRDAARAAEIEKTRVNAAYLPGNVLSERITARADMAAVGEADLVLLVVPAQQSRAALRAVGAEALKGKPVVLCAKGLEEDSLDRQSEILAGEAPEALPLVLSGPSFARDVVAGRPTAVTLAAHDASLCAGVMRTLAGPTFRLYASSDVTGVELAGALKNVYALGCGAVEGAGLGLSARSALIARGFAELNRLVVAMGGRAVTMTGLAGLGDLTLTCTSSQSRNYQFGLALGQGRKVEEIMASGAKLAEGVMTAPVAQGLAEKHGVDMPLIAAVNLLLAGTTAIGDIVTGLMTRPLKWEGE